MQTLDDILSRAAEDVLSAVPNRLDARLEPARRTPHRGVLVGVAAVALVAAGLVVAVKVQLGQLDTIHVEGLSTGATQTTSTGPTGTRDTPVVPGPDSTDAARVTGSTSAVDPVLVLQPVTILLVGIDAMASTGALGDEAHDGSTRADTIMLVTLDSVEDRIVALSLPRDLWVDDGVGRRGRLSTFGGDPSTLVDIVGTLVPGGIHHFAAIDMDGLVKLVDFAGGITMNFDQTTRDRHTGLMRAAGCGQLDGRETLAYLRSRHLEVEDANGQWVPDASATIGRDARQRDLMRRVLATVLTSDYSKADEVRIVVEVLDDLHVDQELDVERLHELFAAGRSIGADRFVSLDLSGAASPEVVDGQAVLVPNAESLSAVVESFRSGSPAAAADQPTARLDEPIVPVSDC